LSSEDPTRASVPESPASVFRALSRLGDVRSRVVLEPLDEGPAMETQDASAEGRYLVLGEIARGGVGIVLRSRDVDLGRDVAMKVLRDEFAENDDVLQRFIEEAQIGGQLQHPGIVPVYEMGLNKEGRPYFTMKLIKGKTLTKLLLERDSPQKHRRRLLQVFESVCETLAYTHARGVVHRDLKPSNIMVGAFGQVLVVDWGLAKVRSRGGVADEREARKSLQAQTVIATVRSESDSGGSMVGSVIGTPGYMPPEQARGDVEQMDERSDVFALGAILCEILTGKPPYVGTDKEMIIQAARAQLDDARERLRKSGADEALIALTDACLSPAPLSRPRDAGEILAELSKHFADVENRAQEARRAATAAGIRAEEARRSRKLTSYIAAAIVAVLLIAGGSGIWLVGAREARLANVRANVADAMGEAEALLGRASTSGDVEVWSEAVLAARRAQDLAEDGDADAETVAAVGDLLAEIQSGEARAREAEGEQQRRAQLLRRLDALRLDAWNLDPGDAAARYAQAFGEYGIDPDELGRAEVVARIRDAGPELSVRLATSMDAWAAARRRAGLSDGVYRDIARTADDDPWRTALRDAGGLDDLRRLAAKDDLGSLPLESLSTLATSLADAGDIDAAAAVAARILRHHPDDLWAHSQYAIWLVSGRTPRPEDAVEHSTVAIALRPDVAEAWANHAWVLSAAGDYYEARSACEQSIRIEPENPLAHALLGHIDGLIGDREAAVVSFERAIETKPELAIARLWFGDLLWRMGRVDEAHEQFREAVRLEGRSARAHADYGRFLFETGSFAEGVREMQAAVEADPGYVPVRALLGSALTSLGDDEAATAHLAAALAMRPTNLVYVVALAANAEARGQHEEALEHRRRAVDRAPTDLINRQGLIQSLGRLGRWDDAVIEAYRMRARVRNVASEAITAETLFSRGRLAPRPAADEDLDEADRMCAGLARSTAASARAFALGLQGKILQRRDAGGFLRAEEPIRRARDAELSLYLRTARVQAYEHARSMRTVVDRVGLDAIDEGTHDPASASEALTCARAAYARGRYAAAARYGEQALSMAPDVEELEEDARVFVARCAVLAAAGKGEDGGRIGPRETRRLRGRALDWLSDELDRWTTRLESSPREHVVRVRAELRSWLTDADLAFVRAEGHLADLTSKERDEYRRLWEDVVVTLAQEGRARFALLTASEGAHETLLELLEEEMRLTASSLQLARLAWRVRGRLYGPEQATGPRDCPRSGDLAGTWSPLEVDAGEEWLELDFARPDRARELRVFTTQGANAISRVDVMEEGGRWSNVWEGLTPVTDALRPATFDLTEIEGRIASVRVEFRTDRAKGKWTLVDAVELVGDDGGQWAVDARASSTYADR
jgi:serine/threonine-protein kinase